MIKENVIEDYKFTYNHDLRCIINKLQSYDYQDDVFTNDKIRSVILKYSTAKLRKVLYTRAITCFNKIFPYIIDNLLIFLG